VGSILLAAAAADGYKLWTFPQDVERLVIAIAEVEFLSDRWLL